MVWTVLVVDDHPEFRALARAVLEADGFEVARRLHDFEDPPRVILTSGRGRSFYRRRLAADGAPPFVPKNELSGPALERLIA